MKLRVVNHPLNKKQQGSKEPWSGNQKIKWEEDAQEVKKQRGHQQIIPAKMIQKQSRKKPGKMIWRQRKEKKTWIAPTMINELNPSNCILVIDIEKCSNFGYEAIRYDANSNKISRFQGLSQYITILNLNLLFFQFYYYK